MYFICYRFFYRYVTQILYKWHQIYLKIVKTILWVNRSKKNILYSTFLLLSIFLSLFFPPHQFLYNRSSKKIYSFTILSPFFSFLFLPIFPVDKFRDEETIFYNVSLLLLFLFLSIVPQTNSRKTIFYNIFPSFSIFIISLLTNFSLSANTRKTIVPSPSPSLSSSLFYFFLLSPFPSPKKRFLKTLFTNSMKGEINPRRRISTGKSARDNDRAVVKLD